MDEHDEREADSLFPSEPVTERVRIVGAEPAGVLSGETEPPLEPVGGETWGGAPIAGAPNGGAPIGEDLEQPLSSVPELQHWTDPPTGQVPAVLDRRADEDDDTWNAGDTGPVWREHQHEWEDDSFEPALLADEWTRVGAMEETPVEERRPWEFDDLTPPPIGAETDDDAGAPGALPEPEGFGATTPAPAPASWWEEGADRPAQAAPGGPAVEPVPTPEVTLPPASVPATAVAGAPVSTPAVAPADAPPDTNGELPPVAAQSASAGTADRPLPPAAVRPRPRDRGRTPPRAPAPPPGPRNVPVAVATGVGIAAVALGCFAAGTVAALALATVVVTLAAAECFAGLRRAGLRPATLLGLVATVAVMVSAYAKGVAALPLVLVLVVVTSMIWYLVGAERGSPVQGISATVLGFAWIGLLGSFAGLLLAPSLYPDRHGIAFLLGAVVATVGEDVGALAVGSWMGRHQLAPHVSPNKTWEGTIGGAVLAVVLSAAVTGQVHPWTPSKAAILGVVVAVVAPIGDLCESLVKRDLGLKDMGSLLPGHGGVLDRVDALLFVLPATYYLVRVLNLG